jgi:glutamate synthase (NADPH) small chain
MGKPTAFLEIDRSSPSKRARDERVGDSLEIERKHDDETLKAQASRCMDCGIPFCHNACPLENLIPEWNDLVYRGHSDEARERLLTTNNFPEFTGRLCPAPCEAACVLSLQEQPVTIKAVEVHIADRDRSVLLIPRPAARGTGRRVAIVGSGPAGLAAAQELARVGHEVVVFEKADRPGGLLRYGIPDFKMEKQLLDDRLAQLRAEGVSFVCGVDPSVSPGAEALRETFDAVILAIGAQRPRTLSIEGAELEGVVLALDYLTSHNRFVAGDHAVPSIDARDKHVIILGGGDTGADCLGTAHRQRAKTVTQIEIADRPGDVRPSDNPWPLWPKVFRVSPAHEEGGDRLFSLSTTRFEGIDGRVARLHAERIEKENPSHDRATSFPADLVLIAAGYLGPEPTPLLAALGVDLDNCGRVRASRDGETSARSVFAIGDARVGASLVVTAIADGRRVAHRVHSFLSGQRALPMIA